MQLNNEKIRQDKDSGILEMAGDAILLFLLSKIDQYGAECECYEKKYNSKYSDFEKKVHSVKNHEDFSVEEDLEDWEFAEKSLNYWKSKYRDIEKNHVDVV